MRQPLPAVASFRKGLFDAQSPRQRGKNIEIVARFADRVHGPAHRDQPWIGAGGADIVALQRHGRRQHDVGKFRHRRPGALVHDDGLRDIEGAPQPVDVLVMMERVAARPIDQLDIGVLHRAAVVFEPLARIEQHVGDARDRDEVGDAVLALRQRRNRNGIEPAAGVAERTERVIISAAGQADLAEHGREHRAHPHRLLAILRPLQRMRDRDQGAPARQNGARGRRSSAAGMPVISAAHAASFGVSSSRPSR